MIKSSCVKCLNQTKGTFTGNVGTKQLYKKNL